MISAACNQNKSGTVHIDLEALEGPRVLKAAEIYLKEPPITVTAAKCDRSAGGLHDYYSEGDYWWPNPDDPDGPYIRKDGLTNPDNFTAHRQAMRRLSIQVPALVAAYKLTGEEKYANHAMRHLKAWFIDKKTMMNPNLLYAQAIKGRVTGRGIGIIDTIHLVEVVQAIMTLEKMDFLTKQDTEGLKSWFAAYLKWITTHPYGKKERDNGNNHSTCWAMQVAQYAKLTGNPALLDSIRSFYKTTIVPNQIASDGSFPKELKRTKPYGYSLFNLDALAAVCQIASDSHNDLWHFKTSDGRGIEIALAFMYPYIKDKSKWPYPPDVMYFNDWPVRQPSLLFGGLAFNKKEYIDIWEKLNPDPRKDEILRNYFIRQPLLWIDIHAF